ncbi:hypothetical protein BGZ98_008168 [Dissophora globulifera]|nr:hypothetical protein BGZ98_008168 [Dissophora globulifera]
MSHQRASSASTISNAFDNTSGNRPTTNTFSKGAMGMAADPTSTSPPTSSSTPLSISVPRQRSFSSSFSLAATSPRTFVAVPNSATGASFLAAFPSPLSPSSASAPNYSANNNNNASTAPALHRRFSSSFNQLNQIAGSSTAAGSQTTERGRRASFFSGTSPPMMTAINTSATPSATDPNRTSPTSATGTAPVTAGGLFRKFSTTGRSAGASMSSSLPFSAGHPFDKNDTGPTTLGESGHIQSNSEELRQSVSLATAQQQQHDAGSTNGLLSAVDKLKPSQDKHSRSSSPMRSMILNGQMLD